MRRLFIIILFFNFSSLTYAQLWQNLNNDAGHFLSTGKDLGISIWDSGTQSRLYFLTTSVGIVGLTLLDESVQDFALEHRSSFSDKLFNIDDYYGDKWYMLGSMGVLYLGGLFSGHDGIRETGLLTAEAYFYTAVLTVITKEMLGRSRPYLNSGPYTFNPFVFKESKRSFFSGHTSTVFAVSTVMASSVDNRFWKFSWYSAAVITGAARMYHDKHWLSDVTAGAIVGYMIGEFVVNRQQNLKDNRVEITSGYSGTQAISVGLGIRLN